MSTIMQTASSMLHAKKHRLTNKQRLVKDSEIKLKKVKEEASKVVLWRMKKKRDIPI